MAKRRKWWSRNVKLAATGRMESATTMEGLAAETGLRREMLLNWLRAHESGGADSAGLVFTSRT